MLYPFLLESIHAGFHCASCLTPGGHYRRALDNIFVERLWRSVKYEEGYLKDYQRVSEAVSNLQVYFTFYNHERLHQALDYQTPARVYFRS